MVMWVIIITLLLSSASFSFVNFYILIFSETTALIGIKLGRNAHCMVLYKVDVFFCLEIYFKNKRSQGAKHFLCWPFIFHPVKKQFWIFFFMYLVKFSLYCMPTDFLMTYCFQCHPFAILIDNKLCERKRKLAAAYNDILVAVIDGPKLTFQTVSPCYLCQSKYISIISILWSSYIFSCIVWICACNVFNIHVLSCMSNSTKKEPNLEHAPVIFKYFFWNISCSKSTVWHPYLMGKNMRR